MKYAQPIDAFTLPTVTADETLNVLQRLEQLQAWQDDWKRQDSFLVQRVNQLDGKKRMDVQLGAQINSHRRRLRMQLVKQPLEIDPNVVKRLGYAPLRQHLTEQFATLSMEDRLLWLNNYMFIMTPDLRLLNDKIAAVRSHRAFGQQRNFLLGGESGMGKSTYLDWFTSNHMPTVERERNHVPIIKIDAPVGNQSPKPLFQRMILECGLTFMSRDNEEDLLMQLALYFQQCGVEMVIVDEVQHIIRPELRRRLLEVSNQTHGVPIVCASCHPLRWIDGDPEVEGRWNDYFELRQYTGDRLSRLLSYIELLLPFTQDSLLAMQKVHADGRPDSADGPARLIERWTGGILRDIMILIADASARAIRQGLPKLTPTLLEETWKSIQTRQVTDFLEVLQRHTAASASSR